MSAPEWTRLPDLASRGVGGGVVWANDEFFAERENLVNRAEPAFQSYTFGHKGQVYDGWETRRRREPGDDAAIVRLGLPGVVRGVVVDTAFFTGNHPVAATVEATSAPGHPDPSELDGWRVIVPRAPLGGDRKHHFAVTAERRFTHVRLTAHPDGGIARLRVHGDPVPDPELLVPGAVDLAALENGARVVGCSDMFYGSPTNLLAPGQAAVMGEGWETARRRDDGNDWVEVELAGQGVVALAELDTSHFKGNAPGWASVRGRDGDGGWVDLLPRTRLQPDTRHRFRVRVPEAVTRARLDIFPDGGMARLRLLGALTDAGLTALARRFRDLSS
ncbi:allantoicase [Actinosynnema pretiosum subsp. pretiosum]|uniref:Probable allantoicase n=2 Tax=Actinosynnema TaxID=40566 RepID=C6WEW9_ACTMD|nr:allantoicase [Actinosynnema mirum]ACU39744.1 allantoicase [Actinosynnema mirum DSM 43827]AXX33254.1 Allantoicase [Actinosynnema pretiosum subsp. pretiosum]QUF02918.1 allantoicase [Actinosynnema pretiosum subsp. pretiosum]